MNEKLLTLKPLPAVGRVGMNQGCVPLSFPAADVDLVLLVPRRVECLTGGVGGSLALLVPFIALVSLLWEELRCRRTAWSLMDLLPGKCSCFPDP